jgi:anti-sigma regulatory factor (Ser/Thr protein kinase)
VGSVVGRYSSGACLVDGLVEELQQFAADPTIMDDDVTLVALQRDATAPSSDGTGRLMVLDDFSVASVLGNERDARLRVARAVEPLDLAPSTVERVKTAVAEAVMNAIEHGNDFEADRPVDIRVLASVQQVIVEIVDQGGDAELTRSPVPDLDAKLDGVQSPRGWGLFLIEQMVDEMEVEAVGDRRRVRLGVRR